MTTQLIERLAIEADGEGDAILMIHGLGGTSNTWTPLMAALRNFKVVRFDLPGAGRSQRVEGVLSIERFVQAALRALSACGAQKAHVVGHSLGTIVAQHLAVAEPKLVRSLALFGPLFAPSDAARPQIRARAHKARTEGVPGMQAIADALVQASTSSETKTKHPTAVAYLRESLMRQDADGYARCCEALAEAQAVDPTKLECPVLLVTGDEDVVAPPQSVRQMGDKIRGSRVEVLRACGHWTPIEKPQECSDLLKSFYVQRMVMT
jgi:pimeloyl-ACP methyl ester carboxylesterase